MLTTVRTRRGRRLFVTAERLAPARADGAPSAHPELLEVAFQRLAKLVAEALDLDLIRSLHSADEIVWRARRTTTTVELLHPQLRLRDGFLVLHVETAERHREIAEREETPPQHPPFEQRQRGNSQHQ